MLLIILLNFLGGVNDLIEKMKCIANEKRVPYVFSLNRNSLGKLAHKHVPASVIGIINYDGSEVNKIDF